MSKEPEYYFHVFYRLDLTEIGKRALYYLDEEQLALLADTLSKKRTPLLAVC